MTIDSAIAVHYAQALQSTVADPSRCTVPWGAFALSTAPVWPYDRLDAACTEPATHTVQADNGDRYVVCDGHALTARSQITDCQVLPGLPA